MTHLTVTLGANNVGSMTDMYVRLPLVNDPHLTDQAGVMD